MSKGMQTWSCTGVTHPSHFSTNTFVLVRMEASVLEAAARLATQHGGVEQVIHCCSVQAHLAHICCCTSG
jgi:hypothetical protein